MYLLILLLPLLSSIFCGFFGRKIGYEGVKIFSSVLILLAFLLSISSFIEVIILNSSIYIKLWS